MTSPTPAPPTASERSGLQQSITASVRTILSTVPRDASASTAQRALYAAGIAMPLPVVTGWLEALHEPHAAAKITHQTDNPAALTADIEENPE